MAYVVARPKGRFEIRESLHTPNGPRARTLANYGQLTDKVLEAARRRASRPFDVEVVRASASRARSTAEAKRRAGSAHAVGDAARGRRELGRFVESSRRMAASIEARPRGDDPAREPGDVLIELLELTDQISAFRDASEPEPLRFPPLARLRAGR